MAVHNIFIKLLDGSTAVLQSLTPTISIQSLKLQIQTLTQIPPIHQRLITGTQNLASPEALLTSINGGFPTLHLLLRLRGGKGGFGSLLRGAATKAGQKKTNNFDACRDMSGRRLRHVNAEKRLREWKEEEPLRELEKKAEEFIRKKVKMGKKKGGKDEEKWVEKYRVDSEKCMNDVENAVRDSFASAEEAKRKILPGSGSGLSNKRLKLWMTKNKGVKSDSDDEDSDIDSDSDSDENDSSDEDEDMDDDDEKSVVIDRKDSEGTSGSASEAGASDSGSSEEEKMIVGCKEFEVGEASVSEKMDSVTNEVAEPKLVIDEEKVNVEEKVSLDVDVEVGVSKETTSQSSDSASPEVVERPDSNDNVVEGSTSVGIASVETVDDSLSEKPLDFGVYKTAAEMEVLGIERLKTELQANGLKCGGTLHERAARLFLLKTTPLDKLPKKLFAKK